VRIGYAAIALALVWQWLASIGIFVTWLVSPAQALKMWKLPFYAMFTLPVLGFALALLSASHQQRVLRLRESTE
jgi:phosphate/sulfate permease